MAAELVSQIVDILKKWAKKHKTNNLNKFYVFGSLINENGKRFLPDRSDIDLIVIIQNSVSLTRAKVCQKLQKAKCELEQRLLPILKRKSKSKSIVSLVLVTEDEVIWDIHKSKVPRFFRDNKFLNLLEESDTLIPLGFNTSIGIDNREALSYIIQALEKAQEYRNKYCSISSHTSKEYKDKDIFPKDLARSAAQVQFFEKNDPTKKFDIDTGYLYLLKLLPQKARNQNNEWYKLQSKVEKRLGRIQSSGFNDFDLLLLHELLFDKASALLKQNSSINMSKGSHPARDRGTLPAPPSAKVQSKKTPEVKTKSESLKKTPTTPQKTRGSTTSTTRSTWTGTVKEPGDWVMLNEKFYLSESIAHQQDRSIVLQLSPMDREQVTQLKSLHPGEFHNKKQIAYADQFDAGIMQVSSMLPESSAGKTRFNITLTPTQNSQNSGFLRGMNYGTYSADEIAKLRVRRILLGEPLPEDLEQLFPTTQVEKGIFPELRVNLQTQAKSFLPKAWLKAVYCLKINGIVEDVLELELGAINNKVMRVRFRGRRQAYTYQQPTSIIEFEGSCTLSK